MNSSLLAKVYPQPEANGMGEVRVAVKLINATDDSLARSGRLAPDAVRVYLADALVDTGAVRSVLPPHVVAQLGIGIRGRREAVEVTEPVIIDWQGRDVIEDALVLGDEVILGQTALEKMDVLVDCINQTLVPNPAHPDQPVSKVKRIRTQHYVL